MYLALIPAYRLNLDSSNLPSTDPGLWLSCDVSHRLSADIGHCRNLGLGYKHRLIADHGLSSDLSGTEPCSHQIRTKASVPSAGASHAGRLGRWDIQGRPVGSGMVMWGRWLGWPGIPGACHSSHCGRCADDPLFTAPWVATLPSGLPGRIVGLAVTRSYGGRHQCRGLVWLGASR